MESLGALFGEQSTPVTLVLIVLGLATALVLLFWIFRKLASGNALRTGRNRQPRLSVTDAAVVDDKRRLVLVRRDDVEHLVMIGGLSDFVIEQNISMQGATIPVQPPENELHEPGTEVTGPRLVPLPPRDVRPVVEPQASKSPPEPRPQAQPARDAAALPVAATGATATSNAAAPAPAEFASKPDQQVKPSAAPASPPPTAEDNAYDDLDIEFAELGEEIEAAASREAKAFGTGSGPQNAAQPSSQPVQSRPHPQHQGQKGGHADAEMEDEMQKLLNELAKA